MQGNHYRILWHGGFTYYTGISCQPLVSRGSRRSKDTNWVTVLPTIQHSRNLKGITNGRPYPSSKSWVQALENEMRPPRQQTRQIDWRYRAWARFSDLP